MPMHVAPIYPFCSIALYIKKFQQVKWITEEFIIVWQPGRRIVQKLKMNLRKKFVKV